MNTQQPRNLTTDLGRVPPVEPWQRDILRRAVAERLAPADAALMLSALGLAS